MPTGPPTESDAHDFYLRTMEALNAAGLPYLVGGGYALDHYTGVERDTKDFDIFVRRLASGGQLEERRQITRSPGYDIGTSPS